MTLTSRNLDRVDGPLDRERILDWMRRCGINPDLIDQARRELPDPSTPTGTTISWHRSDSTAPTAYNKK